MLAVAMPAGASAATVGASPAPASQPTRSAPAGDAPPSSYTPPAPADLSRLSWSAAFEALHRKMVREYAFTDWKGIDWSAMYAAHAPRIARAEAERNETSYYVALRSYLHHVPDGHVSVTDDPGLLRRRAGGGYGLVLGRLDDGQVAVTWLQPGGPAARAGVALGATALRWNGTRIDTALARTSTLLAPNMPTTARERYEQLRWLTRDPVATRRTVTFRNPGSGATRTVTLTAVEDDLVTLTRTDSRSILTVSGWPTRTVEHRVLPGNIGYVRVVLELDLPAEVPGDHTPTVTLFRRAISEFVGRKVAGIVVDVRGNAGGSDDMVPALVGSFYAGRSLYEYQNYLDPRTGRFGIWRVDERTGRYLSPGQGLWITPTTPRYRGPVVALIDNACISSCEGIAMAIARLPQGRTVGFVGTNGSFGMAGDGALLPGNLVVRFPFGQSLDAEKVVQIDSRHGVGGVAPQVRVPMTARNAIAAMAGRDVVLAYGLSALQRIP